MFSVYSYYSLDLKILFRHSILFKKPYSWNLSSLCMSIATVMQLTNFNYKNLSDLNICHYKYNTLRYTARIYIRIAYNT